MKSLKLFAILLTAAIHFLAASDTSHPGPELIDLSGSWDFRLDPNNEGLEQNYQNKAMPDSLSLPGALQAQGYGNIPCPQTLWWGQDEVVPEDKPWLKKYQTPDNYKTQQFLLPDRHYIGAAWYSREFEIPDAWAGKRISLFLERCHWESRLWINGKPIGTQNSLATPHIYELDGLAPGKHRLVLRIDNSEIVNLGKNPHSVSEQTAGTWNGIVGRIELRASDPVWIDQLRVQPHTKDGLVRVNLRIGNLTGKTEPFTLTADAAGISKENNHDPAAFQLEAPLSPDRYTHLAFDYPMGSDIQLWDEFTPHLYRMEVALNTAQGSSQTALTFGLRDFQVKGTQFSINGVKTFLRGNTDCAVMPKTGYAPMDVESWRKVWQTYKDFGLNMARFHSWCPPEAAFVAANEVGIYLAPEACEWAYVRKESQWDFLRAEARRILETYGHHPSFVMMALGNEFAGNQEFFTDLIEEWKAFDSNRAYTIKANSPSNPDNIDFEAVRGTGKGRSIKLRYQGGWPPKPQNSDFNTMPPQTQIDWRKAVDSRSYPLIQHESAQFCAYPNIDAEAAKYTGYLKASYLDIAREQLKERGMWDQVDDFVAASGKWQMELTREEFEAAYRTPGLSGFHWLSLADFTGQTTAPVGFTDAFYDPKPYVDPAYVRRWNAPTVLLARMDQRILTQGQSFQAGIEVTHYGREKLRLDDARATLRTADGEIVHSWPLPEGNFTQGSAQAIGEISLPLSDIPAPAKLNLLVESPANELANDWNIWVFPEEEPAALPEGIHLAHSWDDATRNLLAQGGTVLLLPKQGSLKGGLPICFTTHYWTSFGSKGGQSSASGILLDHEHPLFSHFPTESHANWQWWDLLTRCQPMILDSYDRDHHWPKAFRPLVQLIDSWKINRKLALVAEAKVGKGKLLICSIDLENDLEQRPATRQFRKSLFAYLQSESFDPQHEVGDLALSGIFGEATGPENFNMENLPSDG